MSLQVGTQYSDSDLWLFVLACGVLAIALGVVLIYTARVGRREQEREARDRERMDGE